MNASLAKSRRAFRALFTMVALLAWGSLGWAADYSLLGFGTLGYAVSDQKAAYLRYIDKQGTFKADSLIGLQGEAQFSPQWGATIQVVGSAPRSRDENLEATVRWAFVSYRPTNEWLIRAGRIRPPVLMNTQNAEVGMTYDAARLPAEVYSLSPVYDVEGVAVTRSWASRDSDLTLEGYWGASNLKFRLPFQRDPNQTTFPDKFFPETIVLRGLVATYSTGSVQARVGVHKATIRPDQQRQFVDAFNPIQLPAPFPVGGTLFVPGNTISKIDIGVLTVGADWHFDKWTVTSEYGRRAIKDTQMGVGSKSGFFTVSRAIDKWVPFVTFARLVSPSETRRLYRLFDSTSVPLAAQGPPLLLSNSYHRTLADGVFVYDQRSIMLGASYKFTPNSKLKFELMRTRIGLASALVDGDVHHKSFNVLSMSYNFVF